MTTAPLNTPRKSAGFTLIELVIVLIILGVLAAVAAPRFIDLGDDATRSTAEAQASNITSANTINIAACRLGNDDCVEIDEDDCDEWTNLFPDVDGLEDVGLEGWDVGANPGNADEQFRFELTEQEFDDNDDFESTGDTNTCYIFR